MTKILPRLIGCCLMLVVGCSQAAEVKGLYHAAITVDYGISQQQAAQTAMQQVLIKVSGNPAILQNSNIRQQMDHASHYLLSYQYNMQGSKRVFDASFDQPKVDSLIKNNDFPIWGAVRPSTLLWLAVQPHGSFERSLLSEQSQNEIKQAIAEQAKIRGLDLHFPLLDLDDLKKVSVYDVWGQFGDNIQQASKRYQADAIVMARLYEQKQDPSQTAQELADVSWQLDYTIQLGSQPLTGTLSAVEQQDVLTEFVNQMANLLAAHYAVNVGASETVQHVNIVVNNVSGLQVSENIRQFLNQLTAVQHASLVNINGRKGTYALTLQGTEQDLLNALHLADHMQRQQDQFGQPVSDLEFVWIP